MECREVGELADSFLSQELGPETDSELLRHVEMCAACRADLTARRALRESVRRAFRQARDLGPAPGFAVSVRAKLHEAAGHEPPRRGVGFAEWWVLAGTVLAAMVLAAVAVRHWHPGDTDER